MLEVNVEQIRVFRELKEEGRLEVRLELVPRMLARGLSVAEVAEIAWIDSRASDTGSTGI